MSRGPGAAAAAACASLLATSLWCAARAPQGRLRHLGRLEPEALRECSGLVASRGHAGVFWAHNDSGNAARLFAVHRGGTSAGRFEGVLVKGATNVDWEDIASDGAGRLYVGDIGNNGCDRTDLTVYVVAEPEPSAATAWVLRRVGIHYPEQSEFPDPARRFDAEALFWARGKLYLLTKPWRSGITRLYRLDSAEEGQSNPLTLIGSFAVGAPVTGAAASPDGSEVAVLTYSAVWRFRAPKGSDRYFEGQVWRASIAAGQCEAVCYDGERLLIANEERDLYTIGVADLASVGE